MKNLLVFSLVCLFVGTVLFASGTREEVAAETGPRKLVVWCHAVHKQVADGTRGGAKINILKDFEAQHNAEVEWVSIPWNEMQNKVLRELSFPDGQSDVIFVLSGWADRNTLNMLVPLNDYIKKDPIEEMGDIQEGLQLPFKKDGQIYGIPYRITLRGLHYNKRIFKERGIAAPPKTQEELFEIARKLTYKRSDGAQVYGLGFRPGDITTYIRGYGGYVLSHDYKIGVTNPEVIRTLEALKSLYQEGALPPNFSVLTSKDIQALMTGGMAVMASFPDGYYTRFNNPEKSQEAGNLDVSFFPATKEQGLLAAPSDTAVWAACIPNNSKEKNRDLAYQFIKFFAGKEAQLMMALNGNSPVRASTYAEEDFKKIVPYASISRHTIKTASPSLPTFAGTAEVTAIIQEEGNAAIMGEKDVRKAMDDAHRRIETVLKETGIK